MKNSSVRIWQIDFLRGIAICLMAAFHFVFDLNYYWGVAVSYQSGFWFYVGKLSAILFTFIAGVSASVSSRHIRRGLVVLGWGVLITLATFLLDSQTYIRFGILHMQGSCMLIYSMLKNLRPVLLTSLGAAVFVTGQWTVQLTGPAVLLPFGVMPAGFYSLDYYPLLPWASLFLFGAALGKLRLGMQTEHPGDQPAWVRPFTAAGKRSLEIYLLHQPVLIGLLWVWNYFK